MFNILSKNWIKYINSKNSFKIIIFCLVILTLPVIYPLFKPQAINTYDTLYRLTRAAKYYLALKQGQIPPRWIADSYHGVGEPIFVYLYPFPYILTTALHILKLPFVYAVRLLFISSFIGSVITMYILLSQLFKKRAAFVGSLLFVWAPYRMVQLYVRGALEETMAYFFIPLIFLFIWLVARKKRFSHVWGGLCLGLLILTQSSISLMFLPSILFFMLIIIWIKQPTVDYLLKYIGMLVIGFSLAAMTILPNLFERHYIQLDQQIASIYEKNFIPLNRLIHSEWTMIPTPHMLGKAHILVLIMSIAFLIYIFFKRPKINRLDLLLFLTFILWSLIPIILALDYPMIKMLWKNIKVVRVIYVPYLFLQLSIFWISALAAFLIDKIDNKKGIILSGLFIIITITTNISYIKPDYYFSITDYDLTGFDGPLSQFEEFLPNTAQKAKNDFAYDKFIRSQYSDTNVRVIEKKYHRINIHINAPQKDELILHQLYYPSWEGKIDGHKLFIDYTKPRLDPVTYKPIIDSGLIYFEVPKGNHDILIEFVESPLRKMANFISFITLLYISYIVIIYFRNNKFHSAGRKSNKSP